jgi:hypothetical protein
LFAAPFAHSKTATYVGKVVLVALGRMDEVIDQFFQFESFIVYGSFDFF